MSEPELEWLQFSSDAQEAFGWAAATEVSGAVGTRGLLAGLLRSGGAHGEPARLLARFGLDERLLRDALTQSNPDVAFESEPSNPRPLSDLPPLTEHARSAVLAARELTAEQRRPLTDRADLFGGVLQVSPSTAYTALTQVLALLSPSPPLEEITKLYLAYLRERPSVSLADMLQRGFPGEYQPVGPTPPAESGAEPEPSKVDEARTSTAGLDAEPSLTDSVRSVIDAAAAMVGPSGAAEPGQDRAAILLSSLAYGAESHAPTVASRLVGLIARDAVKQHDRIRAAQDGVRLTPGPDGGTRQDLGVVVQAADALRRRTGDDAVHQRHLLAATLSLTTPVIPQVVFATLGVDILSFRAELRSAIREMVPDAPQPAWDDVLADPPDSFGLAGGVSSDSVDPTVGIAMSEDQLGVGTYVAMLAAVIADGRTPEPLSIGLFGEWGSGKSYFMGLMRKQVTELSRRGDPYCPGIRQIGFNAWHYADTNIWASLGDEIFEQLAGPGPSAQEQRSRLESEIANVRKRQQELDVASAAAEAETRRLTQEYDDALAKRRSSGSALAKAALRTTIADAPSLKGVWERIGIDDPVEQGRLLADEMRGTAAEVDTLRQAVAGRRGFILMVAAAVTIVLAALAIALAIAIPWLSQAAAGTSVVALGTMLAALIAFITRVRHGLVDLRVTAGKLSANLEAAATEDVQRELTAVREAEAAQRIIRAQRDQVVERVGELGRQLAELSPGQRLYRFVAERAGSDQYRSQLGLISTIRKDFEQLVELLQDGRVNGDSAPDRIGRIVLYIDDLDRCSPQQVVEVLQAVHLLLALPLFVVVVGVDPRWLLRSLQSEYDRLLTTEAAGSADTWRASPSDYLEKIFNIPFALPRMSPTSFATLLKRVTGGDHPGLETSEPSSPPEPARPALGGPNGDASGGADEADEAGEPTSDASALPAEAHSEAAAMTTGSPPVELRAITGPELRLLASLAPLVQTPREAKRLANLYRIVRSTRDLQPASRFLGDAGRPGEYEAVVILLGILSSHGNLLEDLLWALPDADGPAGGLAYRSPDATWRGFVDGLLPESSTIKDSRTWHNKVVAKIRDADLPGWRQLHRGLSGATDLVTLRDLEAFQFWAPRIARFSFVLSTSVTDGALAGIGDVAPGRAAGVVQPK